MDKHTLEKEYRSRVNRALDYIETHIDHLFTLEELASVANFSKFHSHRTSRGSSVKRHSSSFCASAWRKLLR